MSTHTAENTKPAKGADIAGREWKGPWRRYDIIKEGVIATDTLGLSFCLFDDLRNMIGLHAEFRGPRTDQPDGPENIAQRRRVAVLGQPTPPPTVRPRAARSRLRPGSTPGRPPSGPCWQP